VLPRFDLEAEHAAFHRLQVGGYPDPFGEPRRVGEEGVRLGPGGADDDLVDDSSLVVDHRRRRDT
jgi:hypothetical protein